LAEIWERTGPFIGGREGENKKKGQKGGMGKKKSWAMRADKKGRRIKGMSRRNARLWVKSGSR